MNVLISIGCNSHTHLKALRGAEKDAKDVYSALVGQNPHYVAETSQLLLSPTETDIISALDKAFPQGEEVGVLTVFFSGHGGVKAGSFFLCTRNSDPDRLSTTAFPITSLFTLINEFHPNQVNIIVDACQAGGSSFDLNQLLKPEVIGSSEASSVAFLGACSSEQFAGDSSDGSVMTRALIKCLTGEQVVQTQQPFLDLIEVGAIVSRSISAKGVGQKPISWGLNLFGNGRFARNPHFDVGVGEYSFPVDSVNPLSEFGKRVRKQSPLFWDEYRLIKDDPNPRRLLDLLDSVLRDAGDDVQTKISFVQGLGRTLCARADESSELFAVSQCLAACTLSLLPVIDIEQVRNYTRGALQEMLELDSNSWDGLLSSVKAGKYALMSGLSPSAELFYLPLRITKTLGWIGLSVILNTLFPDLHTADTHHFELASEILQRYGDSIVAVSDEQAAPIYVFIKACLLKQKREMAERVINMYFASFAERRGNITRADVDGAWAFEYILSMGPKEHRPKDWRPVNTSLLLPVLLLFGAKLGFGNAWDLRSLDRKSSTFFIPSDYRQFGRSVIEEGMNYSHRIGFGVWTVADFKKEFDAAITESFGPETLEFSNEGIALCTIASLLFPNRVPLLLEAKIQE